MKRASISFLFIIAVASTSLGAHASIGCAIDTDPTGDTRGLGLARGVPSTADGATDIVSLSMNSTPDAIQVEVAVRGLTARASNTKDTYTVTWKLHEATYAARAEHDRDGNWLFRAGARRADGTLAYRTIDGVADAAASTATTFVPRALVGTPAEGDVLTDIAVAARETGIPAGHDGPTPTLITVRADDLITGETYEIGRVCADEMATTTGPVVVDNTGDATPRAEARGVMANRALDISSVGFDTTQDALEPSIRVVNPRASMPPGSDLIGWTTSWSYAGSRWVAQASIGPSGTRFSYRALADDSANPSAPIFNATPTTGLIHDDGVITIDLPRDVIGSADDGAIFNALGALSWAAKSGNPSAYHIFDDTMTGAYSVGSQARA